MTQNFPKNYIPPKQGHVLFIPGPNPYPNIEIYAPDTNTLESIITSTITRDERRQIDSFVFLPLYDLIMPTHKPKRKKAPRSQNSFVIFRKNFQAKITHERGPEYSAQLKIISKHAKFIWHSLDIEEKSIYEKIANIANKVHKTIWPNYSYQPNRKDYQRTTINFPTSPPSSISHYDSSSSVSPSITFPNNPSSHSSRSSRSSSISNNIPNHDTSNSLLSFQVNNNNYDYPNYGFKSFAATPTITTNNNNNNHINNLHHHHSYSTKTISTPSISISIPIPIKQLEMEIANTSISSYDKSILNIIDKYFRI
ncbi:hypothetical protein Glove_103g231 [Diversispora epigaea]|uniref:HMG box domain-containing protein n=1 Tax=Diversispora epigaea TaxID=1348612 RepID=A0A397J3J0_9GLOM|nr:hypothetical protein Glove_103g231 [Diversispora epigaea]